MTLQKAAAVLLLTLFFHITCAAAIRKLRANTSADGLHRQAPSAPATYVLGGGYIAPPRRSAESSCSAVGREPITTFEECRSAAEQVGIAINQMVREGIKSWPHVPYGCSVLQGKATPASGALGTSGRVHFSTTPGNNNGGSGGYVLICKNKQKVASRIAVFSAQFGGRDRVQYRLSRDTDIEIDMEDADVNASSQASYQAREELEQFPDGVDAFLFTDMVNVVNTHTSPWHFVYPARQFEEFCDDNVLCKWKALPNLTERQKQMQSILTSKFYKMRWIAENTQYDYILWMDGKYVLRNKNLVETIHSYMGESVDMLAMMHPLRKTVAQELSPASGRAAQILRDNSILREATETYNQYRSEGFSDTPEGLIDSAMFIVRPARVRQMLLDWWHEVQQGIPRDQLSLPWMVQKHGIKVFRMHSRPCQILGQHCHNPGRHL